MGSGRAELQSASGDPLGGVPYGSADYVVDRLSLVRRRVRRRIDRLRGLLDEPTAPARPGFYASHAHVDRILVASGVAPDPYLDPEAQDALAQIESVADHAEADGVDIRLRRLASSLRLSALEVELLLIAAAPAVDADFAPLYAHLNDERRRRQATVGAALALCGVTPSDPAVRDCLGPRGRLVRRGLLAVGDGPLLTAELTVPERVVGHLLGSDTVSPKIESVVVDSHPAASPTARAVASALTAGRSCLYVRDERGVGGASAAAWAFEQSGRSVLALDLDSLESTASVAALAVEVVAEASLRGAGLVVGPVEALAGRGLDAIRAFTAIDVPVAFVGRSPWDPQWANGAVVTIVAQKMDEAERTRKWTEALALDPTRAASVSSWTGSFRLTPLQIARAGEVARHLAASEGRDVSEVDVQAGVRAQNSSGLQRLARRIVPKASWPDLVLPGRVESQLREIPMRWRHRDAVLEDWGLGRGVASGRGVSALFAGDSGTGKTLAAEVIAGDLGLDLYVVDLSTVVDKYIGETSKNLDRIFDQADRVNGVLLFDEADALFGKRSAVSDAKDRHANVEVAFLLQRMESFDGVAILTTNLATNLDEAFLRRLDAIVDFPAPSEEQRRVLWETKLGRGLPVASDVDVAHLAATFRLSGAEIANAVVSAAYNAAEEGRPLGMVDLVRAIIREHRKIGRHLTPSDLGEHASLLKS